MARPSRGAARRSWTELSISLRSALVRSSSVLKYRPAWFNRESSKAIARRPRRGDARPSRGEARPRRGAARSTIFESSADKTVG
jgi:hypothetical protein